MVSRQPGLLIVLKLTIHRMHEDISNSGDGSIYAEMIRNRASQCSREEDNNIVPYGPSLDGRRSVGDADIILSIIRPLSNALPTVMQLAIPWNAAGEVGVQNEGWWGIDARPDVQRFLLHPSQRGQ
jgi:alpha-L-arabinofuranosidase